MSDARVVVFLGPSLELEQAKQLLNATFLPPVAAGDLYKALEHKPAIVAMIDGLFEQRPSVWHKEILYALSAGVRVVGASSMGALRAAELHPYGMHGVGRVFAAYQGGEYEDDDEVAVSHGPADSGFRAVSEAMVNLREGLGRAEREGLITSQTREAIIAALKALYYHDRSWPAAFAAARSLGVPANEVAALQAFVARERPNLKRDDAIECLRYVAAELARGIAPHAPSFEFQSTVFWRRMTARTADRS